MILIGRGLDQNTGKERCIQKKIVYVIEYIDRESLRNQRLLGVIEIDGVNIIIHCIVLNV